MALKNTYMKFIYQQLLLKAILTAASKYSNISTYMVPIGLVAQAGELILTIVFELGSSL